MKKYHLPIFIVCIVVGFGVTYSFLLNNKPKPAEGPKQLIHQVSILKDKAVPDFVAIHPGESVQFNSKDGKEHILAEGHGSGFDDIHEHTGGGESPVIHADEGYRVLFKKVGTYSYHDHDNPEIYITVLVYKDLDKK